MAFSKEEAVIIGCIIGLAVFIAFDLLLWDSDHGIAGASTTQIKPNTTNAPIHETQESKTEQPSFGEMQSPINIVSNTQTGKTKMMNETDFKSNPLHFNYPSSIPDCTIINNGHTVQINIPSSAQCTLSINSKVYTLKQFHFHTPSEHMIDSTQFEMEMHLVHTNARNEIAVLGFIFTTKQKRFTPKLEFSKSRMHWLLAPNNQSKSENKNQATNSSNKLKVTDSKEGSDDESMDTDDEWESDTDTNEKSEQRKKDRIRSFGESKEGNDFLAQFWDELPKEKTEEEIVLKRALSFDFLFETSSNNFIKSVKTNDIEIDMEIFEYNGSLTTPPFTEGVQWLVSKRTHFINNRQLFALSSCWGHLSNARACQEYFGRTVSIRKKSSYDITDA